MMPIGVMKGGVMTMHRTGDDKQCPQFDLKLSLYVYVDGNVYFKNPITAFIFG